MRAVLMFQREVLDKVTRQCHKPQFLKRKESRSGFEPRSFCLPEALPLGQTGSRAEFDLKELAGVSKPVTSERLERSKSKLEIEDFVWEKEPRIVGVSKPVLSER